MSIRDIIPEEVSDDFSSLLRTYSQLVFFVVMPLFVFSNYLFGGMRFRATMVTLLTLLVVGVGILSLHTLGIKEVLTDAFSLDE